MSCADTQIPDFSSFPVFNPQNMEKLRSQTISRPELLKEIIDSFIEESSEMIEDIDNYIKEDNIEMLLRSVHTLKGLAGTIGASRFYQTLSYVDACHKENNFSFKGNLVEIFNNNLNKLKSYFEEEGF